MVFFWICIGLAVLAAVYFFLREPMVGRKIKTFEPLPAGSKVGVAIDLENGGTVTLELFPDVAPQHVASFVSLIGQGFYKGLTFHRVVPGFVVQGGCPEGTGTGGPGYCVKAEFSDRQHLTGTLAMARAADPNSGGSQFYICLAPQPGLDGQYTVFGQVTEGMDEVFKIKKGDVMKDVRILE